MNDQTLTTSDSLMENQIIENELRSFIGEKSNYYFFKWGISENPGKYARWNWSAFICGVFWMGYRKMYKELFVCTIILFLLDITILSVTNDYFDKIMSYVVASIIGTYGNAIYYNYVQRSMNKIKEQNEIDKIKSIRKKGGTSFVGVIIALLLYFGFRVIYSYVG